MVGQTSIEKGATCGSARIPFDFWIEDSRFPAGKYSMECILDTLVMFRKSDKTAQKHAFLMSTGDDATTDDYKLIFTVHLRQRYLQELWNTNGRAVLTSRFGIALAPGDTRIEIPVHKNQPGKDAGKGMDAVIDEISLAPVASAAVPPTTT